MLEVIQSLNSGGVLILVLLVLINPNGWNKKGNLFLGLFMFSVFVQLVDELLIKQGLYESLPYLGVIPILFLLSMHVFLFLGILFYIIPNRKFQLSDVKYFNLVLVFVIAICIYSLITENLDVLDRDIETGPVAIIYAVFLLLFLFQLPLYWYWNFASLKRHKLYSKEYSAAEADVDLTWLRNYNYLYLLMIVMFVFTNLIHTEWMLILANLVYLFGAFLIAYHSVRQKEVFPEDAIEKEDIRSFLHQKTNPESKSLDAEQENSEVLTLHKVQLLELMEEEQPYLDNEINLSKLSHMLDVSTHQLSATLNNAIGMNFSNFVNSYRIEEAKKLLLDGQKQHYTMLQVAYEAGYNSKTVFNTHFKRTIGVSPTAYKKDNLPVISA